MIRTEPEAFYLRQGLKAVTEVHMSILKAEVRGTPRQRIRLCTHESVNDALHEMFVCYTKDTAIQPHKHVGKDETFYVMEGEMTVFFYDADGHVVDKLRMAERGLGQPFCIRVPMDTYHSCIIHSDFCILHESTPGPFRREDTVWAKW